MADDTGDKMHVHLVVRRGDCTIELDGTACRFEQVRDAMEYSLDGRTLSFLPAPHTDIYLQGFIPSRPVPAELSLDTTGPIGIGA